MTPFANASTGSTMIAGNSGGRHGLPARARPQRMSANSISGKGEHRNDGSDNNNNNNNNNNNGEEEEEPMGGEQVCEPIKPVKLRMPGVKENNELPQKQGRN